MRRILIFALTLALCLPLLGCSQKGDTSRVRLDRGASEVFAPEDLRAAMDAAMDDFRRDGEGLTLLRLRYDESYSNAWIDARGLEPDGTILVLLATWADENGRQQTGIPWVLTHSGDGWKTMEWRN